jgi:hypothetical protein
VEEASDLEGESPVPAAVARAVSGSALAGLVEVLRSGPEAAAHPAAETFSPAVPDWESARSAALAHSDLGVEVSPVAKMPDPSATEPECSGSESAGPVVPEFARQERPDFDLV